jgi:cysteine desulfurase
MISDRIYLDFNATTPPLDEVIDAQREAARIAWGNPSSIHEDGRRARALVEDARACVAELAGCDPRDVIFTSGGTEANNLALRSAFSKTRGTLITSRLEHPSVVQVAEALAREDKADVRFCDVDESGAVDLASVEKNLETALSHLVFAIQAVNHETGIFQPLSEIFDIAFKRKAWLHVDAVQAFGRRDDVAVFATTRSISAHKIRGPKGIGALMTLPDVKIEPVLRGGAQERGIRPGTIDPVAAAGFAVAAAHAKTTADAYASKAALRDALEAALRALGGEVNGGGNNRGQRAPHVTNVSFPKWIGAELVAALDLEGVSISSGAACSAGTIEPSPVITAFKGEARAKSAVRISLGTTTTDAEIARAIEAFRRVIARV